ncbi:hypothetical protein [Arcanobacterium bovis]|uniref:Uncharacterized protein n=1 Tax=Arcanobacterium bovis TaxID=2529275 RepID=A0A4Q9V3U3_9ACTO|nr:hypothetical protein [Arcanobacterium bovis]TBW23657.1 hypothetical protein EZJ44_00490 [Arcanobacterium bovis]
MQKTAVQILLGLVLGAITGAIGSIVQAGIWTLPWGGLVLAGAIVVAGTWFSYEIGAIVASFAYVLAMFSVTALLFFFSPSNDVLTLAQDYRAHAWILGSVVLSVATMIGLDVIRRRRSAQRVDDDAVATRVGSEQITAEQVAGEYVSVGESATEAGTTDWAGTEPIEPKQGEAKQI